MTLLSVDKLAHVDTMHGLYNSNRFMLDLSKQPVIYMEPDRHFHSSLPKFISHKALNQSQYQNDCNFHNLRDERPG